jgi:hypothetical protein
LVVVSGKIMRAAEQLHRLLPPLPQTWRGKVARPCWQHETRTAADRAGRLGRSAGLQPPRIDLRMTSRCRASDGQLATVAGLQAAPACLSFREQRVVAGAGGDRCVVLVAAVNGGVRQRSYRDRGQRGRNE